MSLVQSLPHTFPRAEFSLASLWRQPSRAVLVAPAADAETIAADAYIARLARARAVDAEWHARVAERAALEPLPAVAAPPGVARLAAARPWLVAAATALACVPATLVAMQGEGLWLLLAPGLMLHLGIAAEALGRALRRTMIGSGWRALAPPAAGAFLWSFQLTVAVAIMAMIAGWVLAGVGGVAAILVAALTAAATTGDPLRDERLRRAGELDIAVARALAEREAALADLRRAHAADLAGFGPLPAGDPVGASAGAAADATRH